MQIRLRDVTQANDQVDTTCGCGRIVGDRAFVDVRVRYDDLFVVARIHQRLTNRDAGSGATDNHERMLGSWKKKPIMLPF